MAVLLLPFQNEEVLTQLFGEEGAAIGDVAFLYVAAREMDFADSEINQSFIDLFRHVFAKGEVPDYIHYLTHIPMLTAHFGSIRDFQLQSVEQVNKAVTAKFLRTSQFGENQLEQARLGVNRRLF